MKTEQFLLRWLRRSSKGILDGEEPNAYAKEHGLVQLSDPAQLQPIVDEVLDNNEQSIEDFKNGKDRAVGYQWVKSMKQTRGKLTHKLLLNY